MPSWLPDEIPLSDFGGQWPEYEQHIYEIFLEHFVNNSFIYDGTRISCKKHPEINGKSGTFWHIISSGQTESEKEPDLERCSKIAWPKAIMENTDDDNVLVWTDDSYKGGSRTKILLTDPAYLVILANRNGYSLLWTAYPLRVHSKEKLLKEYKSFNS